MDKSAIRARFARLERCIAKLRAATEDLDFDTYLEDEFLQDVLEHNLQIASQIVLDVSTHIIAEQGWEIPDDYEQAVVILARHGVTPQELTAQLRGMAGFRNVLVHAYLEVDQDIVFAAATDHLADYEMFAQSVTAWLDSTSAQ
ncbi:MAG: DUF86 domain-containing protein [Chloroflexi bacterium]|nr:DUF86 domain-containing protein [Chloroflexota bacterium]